MGQKRSMVDSGVLITTIARWYREYPRTLERQGKKGFADMTWSNA
jgi:hypothetical protein